MPPTVQLADRSYPIHIAKNLAAQIREMVGGQAAAGRKLAAITDGNLSRCQREFLNEILGDKLPLLELPPGEETKNIVRYSECLDFLAGNKIDRGGLLIAIGGGVIGDIAGFAAATYLRGIDFVQVPTTLLAMVDSSVGGKTGINLRSGKNLVGAFHQPKAVFISTDFLETLPSREFAAGMAEVIKYGLLADGDLFARLEGNPLTKDSSALGETIRRCCEIKAGIVAADEHETAKENGRALLNLGHTFGHAIEQVTGYGVYLHGEAVSIGLVAAACLSEKLGYLNAADVGRIKTVLWAHNLPTQLRDKLPSGQLMDAIARDKKVRDGKLRFVVMRKIGEAVTQADVSAELAEECFRQVAA